MRLLLKQKPHAGLHAYMDEFSKQLGWGHRLLRHNARMMEFAKEVYGDDGEREAAFHIACDMEVVTKNDLCWGAASAKNRKGETGEKVA